jgi:hypothetical protein
MWLRFGPDWQSGLDFVEVHSSFRPAAMEARWGTPLPNTSGPKVFQLLGLGLNYQVFRLQSIDNAIVAGKVFKINEFAKAEKTSAQAEVFCPDSILRDRVKLKRQPWEKNK